MFGAMDGLVTNIALIAGVGGGGADRETIILTGMAGLVAGAFSMALGEFASVGTQNDAVAHEVAVERDEIRDYPQAEQAELAVMYQEMGLSRDTAEAVAREVHQDPELAVKVHIVQELGVDPGRAALPLDGGDLIVRLLRGRQHHPADPVPARLQLADPRAARRSRGPDRRRRADLAVHHPPVVAGRAAAADVRDHRRRAPPTWSAG